MEIISLLGHFSNSPHSQDTRSTLFSIQLFWIKVIFMCEFFSKTFDFANSSLQTSTIRIYPDSGMWSTDTFWRPPGRPDTPRMSGRCSRRATGPRGRRSSTRGSKCVPRKRWRRSLAATGPITNLEVEIMWPLQTWNSFNRDVSAVYGTLLIISYHIISFCKGGQSYFNPLDCTNWCTKGCFAAFLLSHITGRDKVDTYMLCPKEMDCGYFMIQRLRPWLLQGLQHSDFAWRQQRGPMNFNSVEALGVVEVISHGHHDIPKRGKFHSERQIIRSVATGESLCSLF